MSLHSLTYRALARDPDNREVLAELADATATKANGMQTTLTGIENAVKTLAYLGVWLEGEMQQVRDEEEAIRAALREVAQ